MFHHVTYEIFNDLVLSDCVFLWFSKQKKVKFCPQIKIEKLTTVRCVNFFFFFKAKKLTLQDTGKHPCFNHDDQLEV